MRVGRALIAAALVTGVVGFSDLAAAAPSSQAAQRYIVVLDDGADSAGVAAEHGRAYDARVEHVYRYALRGYAATMSPAAAARVADDPRVDSVEADQAVSIAAQSTPTGIDRSFATSNAEIDIDGLDDFRVDADVAVIDTGIDLDHPQLNVFSSTDCRYRSGGRFNATYSCGAGGEDGNGHGSHVAGTIGAIDDDSGVVGVAPGVRLWAVKVLDDNGSGSLSAVVAGIDYVTANAGQIEVANMSLGCNCTSTAMNTALTNSVAAGITYAVAAGNDNSDASTFSPANHDKVIAVSALADFNGAPGGGATPTCRTDQDDTLADFSNWGSKVDIAAPGVCILSTWKNGGYSTISGTSMASPHVAGAAALLASSGMNVTQVRSTLLTEGNFNWTDDSGDGTKEPLLDLSDAAAFNPALVAGSGGSGGGTTNTAPVASNDSTSTKQDTAKVINVLANDSDADGDPLTVSSFTQPSAGTVTRSGNDLLYTPPSAFTGTTSFTYQAGDGALTSNTATVTVKVTKPRGSPKSQKAG